MATGVSEVTAIFIDNKYTRWYYAIIKQRAIKDKRRKGETHHIIPESFFINRTRTGRPGWLPGNPDDPSNLVKLNGHDHAWCHWLLTKMIQPDTKAYYLMSMAFNMMGVKGEHMDRPKSYAIVRAYEKNRAVAMKGLSITFKEQFANGRVVWNKDKKLEGEKYRVGGRKNKGKVHERTVVEARAAKRVGIKQSAETSEKKRKSMTGFVRGPMSDKEKEKRSESQVGVAKSATHADNIAAGVRGNISINKDGVEKKVKQPQLQAFLDDGWARGGLPRKRKVGA